MGIIQFIKFCR